MISKRKLEMITLGWVMVILAGLVLAGPVAAASSLPQTGNGELFPATDNASAVAGPVWRDGDFVFWVSETTDLSATAATIRAITPNPIGPNGISVKNSMPGFAWAPVLGATEYRFDLYADAGLSQAITSIVTPVPAVAIAEPLPTGQDYYWTVRVTQPAESGRSWASFHVSAQATEPVVQVTTAAASRPRATYSGATDMMPQATALSYEAGAANAPEPIVINLPANDTPATDPLAAALPAIIVIGVLLVTGVLTLILTPYVSGRQPGSGR